MNVQVSMPPNQREPAGEPVQAEPRLPELPLTVIRPPRGWQLVNLREIWQFRDLFYFLTWRDVKVRYKQTLLGAAWAPWRGAALAPARP